MLVSKIFSSQGSAAEMNHLRNADVNLKANPPVNQAISQLTADKPGTQPTIGMKILKNGDYKDVTNSLVISQTLIMILDVAEPTNGNPLEIFMS